MHASFLRYFLLLFFLIIPSKTKFIDSFTYILQFALITSEQIYNAFDIAGKTMTDYVLFPFNWAREGITFCHIHAYLKTLTITFKMIQLIPHQLTIELPCSPKWNHGTRGKCFLTSSVIYKQTQVFVNNVNKIFEQWGICNNQRNSFCFNSFILQSI